MRIIGSTLIVLSLVACSSGGGGTPFVPLPVTAANAESALESALDALDNMFGGTEFTFGSLDSDFTCVTGSTTTSGTDTPPIGQINVGDTITLTFDACVDDVGDQFDGSITIAITALTGDPDNPPFTLGFTVTFNNLTVTEGGESFTATGGFAVTMSDDGAGGINIVMSGSNLTLSGTMQGQPISQSMTNFRYEVDYDEGTGAYTVDFSGTISDSTLGGAVTFETTTPFQGTTMQEFDLGTPDSGVLEITGANNSKVVLTVTGANTVQIQIDADGDGTFETSYNTTWDAVN